MHKDYDHILYVQTTNRGKALDKSPHYNQYEATPYPTLHALFQEYKLNKADCFVDLGCGKGRLLYYVHNRFRSSVTGIEVDEDIYRKALQNKRRYVRETNNCNPIKVKCCSATEYEVQAQDNIFYLFNPFSIQIFMEVINNILLSTEQNPREVDVILYYPPEVYIHYLNAETSFKLVQEVGIPGLYNINKRERFLIYRYQG